MTEEEEKQYREYVAGKALEYEEKVAAGEPALCLEFYNRNTVHAGIVMERIFLMAEHNVKILTNALSEDVYATVRVLDAAKAFLSAHEDARIDILVENPITQNVFLSALDAAGFHDRVSLNVVPRELQKAYPFNFAVADGIHYRLEKSRACRQATVQFGNSAEGARLANYFVNLSPQAGEAQPAA